MFGHIYSRQYTCDGQGGLHSYARGSVDFMRRLKLDRQLEVHTGCVNTICWNQNGSRILSGSDDQHLVISDPYTNKIVHKFHSGHRANIFSAKFLPNSGDVQTVSCSGDGKIIYTDVLREDTYGTNVFECHFGTTYEVIVIPNEASTFLSCGEDGTVRFFDLRAKNSCNKSDCKDDVLINCRSAVTSLASNPMQGWQLAIGCSNSSVRIYDRRMLSTRSSGGAKDRGIAGLLCSFTPPSLERQSYRITSLNYSPDGEDVLVSYSSEYIYLFGTKDTEKAIQFHKDEPSSIKQEPAVVPQLENPTGNQPVTESGSQPISMEEIMDDVTARQPPVKRLRLRGDWSDTGPRARPESERQTQATTAPDQDNAPRVTIMQRMSDLLTRWLDGNMRQGETQEGAADAAADPSASATDSNTIPDDSATPASNDAVDTDAPVTASSSSTVASADNYLSTASVENVSSETTCEEYTSATSVTLPCPVQDRQQRNSSESKSDESQSSFLLKIESMAVNDQMESAMSLDSPHTGGCDSSQGGSDDRTETLTVSEPGLTDGQTGSEDVRLAEECPTSHETVAVADTRCEVLEVSQGNSSELDDGIVVTDTHKSDSNTLDKHECMYNPLNPTVYSGRNMPQTDSTDSESKAICGALGESKKPSDNTTTSDVTAVSGTSETSVEAVGRTTHHWAEPDREGSFLDIRDPSEIRETMEIAVDSLRSRNVEPVISLHYSSEGTSNSTIKLGFTSFRSLEDEMERTSEASREAAATGSTADGAAADVQQKGSANYASENVSDVPRERRPEVNVKTEAGLDGRHEVDMEECRGLTACEDQKADTSDIFPNTGVCDNGSEGKTADNGSASDHLSKCTSDSKEPTGFVPFCPGKSVSNSSLEEKSFRRVDSTTVAAAADNVTVRDVPDEMECDNEAEVADNGKDDFMMHEVTVDVADQQETPGAELMATAGSGEVTECQPSTSQDTGASRKMDVDETEPSGTGSEARRRRIGVSGPSTGDFQMPVQVFRTDTSNSSEDEEEDEGNTQRRPRPQIDRTTAALRLQALHRKRQIAKEKREMELKNVFRPDVKMKYKGHRNARTMIKESNFWGDKFVLSGSDCGHIFIWERETGQPVMLLEADKHVVNCVQPHPYDTLLASSGIDYDIKIWAPIAGTPCYDSQRAEEVMLRNGVMLEETRDTITVPAAFMLRVLASINSIRSGRRAAASGGDDNNDSAESE